jgi:hypothetical protein
VDGAARHRPAAFVVAAAVLAAVFLVAVQRAHPATTATSASVGALRICSDCASTGGDLSRYGYVVLHAWEYGRIAELRAKNPGIRILVYKNASASYSYACRNGTDDALLPAGTGYCAADREHPDWFLQDTAGRRIEFCDYAGLWQMDVGSAAYQQAWLDSVSRELSTYGWDGVVLDDVNSTAKYHLCGRTIAKYPTESAYEEATRTFLAGVGPTLQQRGFLVLPNINFDCWEACWSRYLQYTSGAVREWWSKNTTGAGGQYTGDNWDWANGFLRLTQQQGKIFVGITYAPVDDTRSMRYARASFLLDWDGGPSAFVFEPTPEATDPWQPEWTVDVGRPTGGRYQTAGAWRRDYSDGTVLVNSSASATATVALGGAYLLPDGSTATSATLQPATGLILRRAPTPTTTGTTTTSAATTSTTTSAATTTTTASSSTTTTTRSTTTATTTTTTTPATTILLAATPGSGGTVALTWSGAHKSRVDVVRNGTKRTVANTGSYLDKLGKRASGTFTYQVCEAGTTTCSEPVLVTIQAPALAAHVQRVSSVTTFIAQHLNLRLDVL